MDREKKRTICILFISFILLIVIPSLVSYVYFIFVKDRVILPFNVIDALGVWVLAFFFMLWVTSTALDM